MSNRELAPTRSLPVIAHDRSDGSAITREANAEADQINYVARDEGEDVSQLLAQEQVSSTSDDRFNLMLLDQSRDARDAAQLAAETRLTHELNGGGKIKRFLNGIWKGNIAKDYYHHKYMRIAQDHIEATGTVYAYELNTERAAQAMNATFERFASDYEEAIHYDAGERRETLADATQLSRDIKRLIRQNIDGELTDEALIEERTRLLIEHYREQGDDAAKLGRLTTDNLLAVRDAVRGAVEHGESIDAVMQSMTVTLGETRSGVRTELHRTAVDKTIDKLNASVIGRWVSPEVVAIAATTTASLLRVGSKSVLGAAAQTIVPGVLAGVWAGARENRRVKDERVQHAREMAQGKEFDAAATRRSEMEATRYATVASEVLRSSLEEAIGGENIDLSDQGQLTNALDTLAAVQARVSMSDRQGIDLIHYSSVDMIEEERFALDLAIARAKVAIDAQLTSERRTELGLSLEGSTAEIVNERIANIADFIETDVSEKDEVFKKLKRSRVARAAVAGLVTGVVLGVAAQEGIASVDDTRHGLVEQLWGAQTQPIDGVEHQTILGSLGTSPEVEPAPVRDITIENGEVSTVFKTDQNVIDHHDGTLAFIGPDGNPTVDLVPISQNGQLPQSSIDVLREHNLSVTEHVDRIETRATSTIQVSPDEYVDRHPELMTTVQREFWYDNDTPFADGNELGLHWSGENGSTPDGGFALNVSNMSALGSTHEGQTVSWSEQASAGTLKLAVSASINSQSEVFMLDIAPDGTVIVPPAGPVAHFFSSENGQAVFRGAYAEVVQTAGVSGGVETIRPLATLVGEGNAAPITETITTAEVVEHYSYTITTPQEVEKATFVEMAPVIPVISRRPLEVLTRRQRAELSRSSYGYSPEVWRRTLEDWEALRSPRLRANEQAQLRPREELEFYRQQQVERRGPEYVEKIDSIIERTPELRNIAQDTRAIVVMPVGAAQESENIYRTLSLYAQQDDDALRQTTVLLNVNWIEGAENDPDKKAKIDKTIAEIERAREDFPDVHIASFTQTWSQKWVSEIRKGKIYGEVIKVLYDTAAMTVQKAMQDGKIADDQDILLITNDADARGMHRRYLKHYIETAANSPDSDAFIGGIRWGAEEAARYPGYHVSQVFMQAMNIAATRPMGYGVAPVTIGPNSAFKVSAYAAVGGCIDHDDAGAGVDSELGRKIVAARGMMNNWRAPVYGSRAPGYEQSVGVKMTRQIIKQVPGADIDTSPDRLLNAYRQNKWLPEAWGNFDKGGYSDRNEAVASGNVTEWLQSEDAEKDFDAIKARVERQISDYITYWYPDRSLATFGLSMLFPDKQKDGKVSASWDLRCTDGKYSFMFTRQGARRLKGMLLRDAKGNPDVLGERVARRLYGVAASGKRQPVTPESPLVRSME